MSEFGAGIYLNENWDFEVDASGDLATAIGLDELEKDISFNIAQRLDDTIGRRRDRTTGKRIQVLVEDVFAEDVRVDSVNEVTVRQVEDPNTFEVIANINTSVGEEFEAIFEVSV